MRVLETPLAGVLVFEPRIYEDSRGWFLESYRADRYAEAGLPHVFVQDNHSRSVRGTLRGLHWQWRRPQGKLVRAIEGAIFDVAVDLRPTSPTFRQWYGVELSASSFRQMYVPPGFAHGFCVTSETAQVEYKCTDYYDAEGEAGILWNDPTIAVAWPIDEPLLSDRDRSHPTFAELYETAPAKFACD